MRFRTPRISSFLLAAAFLAPACVAADEDTIGPPDLVLGGDRVHAVLPPDAIPAIREPVFLSAEEADQVYAEREPILGIARGGGARAYSLWHLDRHEIVNDTVGGRALAATW